MRSRRRFDRTDVIVGGPPCQGFSMANRQRLIDDPRNKLYKSYVRAVSIAKSRFFVMENVKGMLSVSEKVKEDLSSLGYRVECRVLNAKDYGVPQNRERLIFIGSREKDDIGRIFDEIAEVGRERRRHVLKDALEGLRPLTASYVKNSTDTESEGSGRRIDRATGVTNEYIELINGGNMYIHPTQARGLTPREAARVQSYPDDYIFLGAYTKTYMQIGNSVPPLLGQAIAKVIRRYL